MNVYDEAHSLARAIKESNEFLEFDKVRKEVEEDKEVSEMIADMQKLQIELQTAQISGQQPPEDLFLCHVCSSSHWCWKAFTPIDAVFCPGLQAGRKKAPAVPGGTAGKGIIPQISGTEPCRSSSSGST